MLTTLISLLAVTNLIATPATIVNQAPSTLTPEILFAQLDLGPIIKTVPFPQKLETAIAPVLEAKSILSQDLETGLTLYSVNADQQLPMASITKLMTAKIILQENPDDQIVTITKEATQVEPSKADLLAGEQITIHELLKALMIKSANDAAMALAIHNAGSVQAFVDKMNAEAKKMGLNNTHFQNPVGFDDPQQYSSANDIAILARTVYKNPYIQKLGTIKEIEIQSVDGKQKHQLQSTDELLNSYLKVLGLKTGTTDLAGQCLVSIVENPNGNRILNVILNSPARFKESKILSQWIFNSYQWL